MRAETHRDLIALLSMVAFVLAFGLGLFLLVFYTFGPSLFGPLDRPIGNGFMVVALLLVFTVSFLVGGVLGGIAWIMVMCRLLPKDTMYKWLTYGPQIKPLLSLNLRLLRLAFKGRAADDRYQ
jgi:hypothetical protein